jgi:nucleotide-binding universal stress UspA family protein
MSDMPTSPRKFLVVVDNTPECRVALRFAARRALHTGGCVTLLCVAEPIDRQEWQRVEVIMREEAVREAEILARRASEFVETLIGQSPEVVIEYGDKRQALLGLIARDRDISILILASGTSKKGPGPLVSLFAGSVQTIPATIVPGNLSDAEVDALA